MNPKTSAFGCPVRFLGFRVETGKSQLGCRTRFLPAERTATYLNTLREYRKGKIASCAKSKTRRCVLRTQAGVLRPWLTSEGALVGVLAAAASAHPATARHEYRPSHGQKHRSRVLLVHQNHDLRVCTNHMKSKAEAFRAA